MVQYEKKIDAVSKICQIIFYLGLIMCVWLKILQNARMRENADPPFSHQKTEVAENKFFT